MALFVSFWINVAIVATFAKEFYNSACAESSADGAPFGCVDTEAMYRVTDSDHNATVNMFGPCSGWKGEYPGTAKVDANGHTNYQCAAIGLQLAGEALRSSLGASATYVWSIGLLCAGQAATTTATYAGQILMAGFFKMELPMWVVMLITRLCALGPAVVIALAASGSPGVQAQMNEWLNVLQSVQLPYALFPVLHFTSKRTVMGRHANGWRMKALCWALAIAILAVNVFLIYTTLPFAPTALALTLTTLYVVATYGFLLYLSMDEVQGFLRLLGIAEPLAEEFPEINLRHRREEVEEEYDSGEESP
jgi:natural resistance-associated macrophage protein